MERTPPEDCGFNSLMCKAAAKIPLNLKKEEMRPQARVVLGNLVNDFTASRSKLRARIDAMRVEYTDVYTPYNEFVMRSDFIEDRDELYDSVRHCMVGIEQSYHDIDIDDGATENCEWFAYFEYLKFNVFVNSRIFDYALRMPHSVYIIAKGIMTAHPVEPSSKMPSIYHDIYRGCVMYTRIIKNLVSRYESMYSYEISKTKQVEYATYLDEYDATKNSIFRTIEELTRAIDRCVTYMYDPFDDMSLDDILGF
jgi:hypothetical protein